MCIWLHTSQSVDFCRSITTSIYQLNYLLYTVAIFAQAFRSKLHRNLAAMATNGQMNGKHEMNGHHGTNGVATSTGRTKKGLAQMLKGGVIMDVMNPEQAKIAERAGACAVMALEKIPADIRAEAGVARMSTQNVRVSSRIATRSSFRYSLPIRSEFRPSIPPP